MESFHFYCGETPLLVSIPHGGVHLPGSIRDRMTPMGLARPDTDWHLGRLYAFAKGLGASVLEATHSRYVVDLNRDSCGVALYPGGDNTALCPVTRFDRAPVYLEGGAPDEAEIRQRVRDYWAPYHAKLGETLRGLRERHGVALLFEAHSICSEVPRFFEGRLPDFNLGTFSGKSCASSLEGRLRAYLQGQPGYSSVVNGRFKGGYITRHYGDPGEGIHAVQLELVQRTYMEEVAPFEYREQLAAEVRPSLEGLLRELLSWAKENV